MTDPVITFPHHPSSIETATIRALMNAVDLLDLAKRETGAGLAADHIENAVEQIRCAVRVALLGAA